MSNMKRFKHILLMVALLAAMLPCIHAVEHHDHDTIVELCALDASPCECHSCEHQPCSADIEIQLGRTSTTDTIAIANTPAIAFPLPEYKPALRQTSPPVTGILAVIQTIQLLI